MGRKGLNGKSRPKGLNKHQRAAFRLAEERVGREDIQELLQMSRSLDPEDRFQARIKLSELPRNSSPVRTRLRCEISGRSRGNYRKFKLSRIALRELALKGQIPGMVKSSW